MVDTKPSALDRWTKIAQIASALSVIVGIVLAVTEIYKTSSEIRESAHVARLNELPSVKEMINAASVPDCSRPALQVGKSPYRGRRSQPGPAHGPAAAGDSIARASE